MSDREVVIVDYAVGNVFNTINAFESLGARAVLTRDHDAISRAELLVLPGVGAFEMGMRKLREFGLVEPVKAHCASGKPLLGICLGMQLLLSESDENGHWIGLDIVPGKVRRIKEASEQPVKIPQIGWNSLRAPPGRKWEGTILEGASDSDSFYFVHSYCCEMSQPGDVLGQTSYGGDQFCSVLKHGAIHGCQFHPERSAGPGIRLLERFLQTGRENR